MNLTNNLPVDVFLPHMPDVSKCERSLHELNLMWRMIEASAKMNCPVEAKAILPTVSAARAGFAQLEAELVRSLSGEKIDNAMAALATKSQYIIDIVVRNLYERTADVGFLATDHELCAFVAGDSADADAMRLRLRAYRSKYTVYDEIILLDLRGNVLVQIDETTPLEGSHDPLIAATLATDGYVETFRASDLRPSKREALIYSKRVLAPGTGAVVGVLCLCFAFEQEMEGIFQTHRDPSGRSNMLLLDAGNRVIASADPLWMPVGAYVPVNLDGTPHPVMYAGRAYLVRSYHSNGYQGYPGPAGWHGQVMIPLDVAFGATGSSELANVDPVWADGLLSHASSFCPPLSEIIRAAEMIRRVVWNGQVMTAGQSGDLARLRTILEQISETGARSNELFTASIRELFETVLDSGLREAQFVTHLMVDLLDRNLYERANDCRWWALSPELRQLVAEAGDGGAERIGQILRYINGLYTVYTSIVVYDLHGKIIGCSRDTGVDCIDGGTLAQVLSLRTEQDYYVTPFEPTPLYGGRPTYVYHAAIRSQAAGEGVIGGIGIVFDAEVEFDAMLRGALGGRPNSHAYFMDRRGLILASTDPSRPIGAALNIHGTGAAPASGDSESTVVTHDGHYAIVGRSASQGYREFKGIDGYRDDVIAVVVETFGGIRDISVKAGKEIKVIEDQRTDLPSAEFATFFVDGELFAIDAEAVSEAIPAARIGALSMGGTMERLGVLELDPAVHGTAFVWVFDLGAVLTGRRSTPTASAQVIIVRHGTRKIGLMVTELHGVSKFARSAITASPLALLDETMLVREVIQANQGDMLIQVIDPELLFALFKECAYVSRETTS